jgi:hypothetical protein
MEHSRSDEDLNHQIPDHQSAIGNLVDNICPSKPSEYKADGGNGYNQGQELIVVDVLLSENFSGTGDV